MANIKSAKKRAKTNLMRQKRNNSRKSELKTVTKKVLTALADNNIAEAKSAFKVAESKIARAKGKGLLKANTAARKISRLAKKIASAEL